MRMCLPAVLWLSLGLACGGALAQEAPEAREAGARAAQYEGEAAPGVVPDMAEREVGKGLASWYGKGFHGRHTASGERFDMHALTAAHPTLPFGTLVRVRSLEDGRTVDVRINDRGPWIKRRVIDLSRAAADALGLIDLGTGTRRVVLSVLSAGDKKDRPPPSR
ncbi:MAG: septal ring lytic transglycosylase RlpA family protein [Ramlibacter sp.]|nr:septal ring lytic transglycosylase RlpA family protein [Ramlibacter sp.]